MPTNELTKYMAMDPTTGFLYGIGLNAAGDCEGVQPLSYVPERFDGTIVEDVSGRAKKIGPFSKRSYRPGDEFPYGKTSCLIEVVDGNRVGQKIFTVVWPTKEEMEKGTKPSVSKKDASKELVADLIRAGIAPAAKSNGKAGVDNEEALAAAQKNIDDMIGLTSAKQEIKNNIALARFNRQKQILNSRLPTDKQIAIKPISRHMVFTGNPGTGKTTFAREVAKVYKALGFIQKDTVHEVKREDLVAGYVGQTAIKMKGEIEKAKGGILFIDEAYSLSYSQDAGGGSGNDFGKEAINTLVAAMENMREDLIVIVAGYKDPMKRFIDSNEGLARRFATYISFEDFTPNELGQILDFMVGERGYTLEPEARAHALKLLEVEKARTKKSFGNGGTVRNLVEKVELILATRMETEDKLGDKSGLSDEELRQAMTTVTLADMQGVSLNGLATKHMASIGLGAFAPAASKNDNTPPAVEVEPATTVKPKKTTTANKM